MPLILLLAFLSCVRRQVLTTSVQNFPSGHQINQPHIVLSPPIHLASLAVSPNAMDPLQMVDFLKAYCGEITKYKGMYAFLNCNLGVLSSIYSWCMFPCTWWIHEREHNQFRSCLSCKASRYTLGQSILHRVSPSGPLTFT